MPHNKNYDGNNRENEQIVDVQENERQNKIENIQIDKSEWVS